MKSIVKNSKELKKTPTQKEKAEMLFERITVSQLRDFVFERFETDTAFLDLFVVTFANLDSSESKKDYLAHLISLKKKHIGITRYTQEVNLKKFNKEVKILLNVAHKHVEDNNFNSAFYISSAILEVFAEILISFNYKIEYCFNSVEEAIEIIYHISQTDITEDLRKNILNFCKKSLKSGNFIQWDWQSEILEIGLHICKNDKEIEKLLDMLDADLKTNDLIFTSQKLKFDTLLKIRNEEEAEQYMMEHLENPKLRHEAIERAFTNKNYSKAISLAEEGAENDFNYKTKLIVWNKLLLKIYQHLDSKNEIIKVAKSLMIDSTNKEDYFQIIKKSVPTEIWDEFLDEFIIELDPKGYWDDIRMVLLILVWEKNWVQLRNKINSIIYEDYRISNIEFLLTKYNTPELVSIYKNEIISYHQNKKSTSSYNALRNRIESIKELGHGSVVLEIINYFKTKFPTRFAMLTQLGLINLNDLKYTNK